MPDYKLTYFNIQARGEAIRLIFAYADVDFTDERIEFADWPKLKPSAPFGQLPILEVDNKRAAQSLAIARYLGKKYGLAGKDDWENLEIDVTVDTINDLIAKIAAHSPEKNAEAKAAKLEESKESVQFYVEKLDEQVAKNGGHFVGGKLTWADFVFVGVLNWMNRMQGCDIIGEAENLKALRDKVLGLPSIKAYVDKRPKTNL